MKNVCRDTSEQNLQSKDLIDDEKGCFRSGKCIDQIFTLKTLVEKAREREKNLFSRYGFEKGYDRVKEEESGINWECEW